MSPASAIRASAYARRVERALSELRGGTAVLSPRDWALISDWHERGVPLAVVLEALEEAATRPGASASALARRGLAVVARAVDESWRTIREGLMPPPAAEPAARTPVPAPIEAWRTTLRETNHEPLTALLDKLIRRFEAGEEASALDLALDAAVEEACEPEIRARARSAAMERLAPYRERMSEAVFTISRRRAVVDRIRKDLALPRLALAEPPSREQEGDSG